MKESTVKIDPSRLLGFRLAVETDNKNAVGAKVGNPKLPSSKIGGKTGMIKPVP